jgi:hypothetical protein
MIGTFNGGTIIEYEIHESSQVSQLISNCRLVRTDHDVIESGYGFIVIENTETGHRHTGFQRLPIECHSSLWIDDPWSQSYETEKDVS